MPLSAIVIEDSATYRNILITLLGREQIKIVSSLTHKEFSEMRIDMLPDIAIVCFASNTEITGKTLQILKASLKATKIGLLVSKYDNVSREILAQFPVDGLAYKGGDDLEEILTMLRTIMPSGK